METRIYSLTRKNTKGYFMIGLFYLCFCPLGFWFSLGGYYSLLFTIIVFCFSIFCAYSGLFHLLSIKNTTLHFTDKNISLYYPFGYKKAYWKDVKHLELSDTSLRVRFNKVQGKGIFISRIFYKADEIPIQLFIENWQDSNTWLQDPLLKMVESVFSANEQP